MNLPLILVVLFVVFGGGGYFGYKGGWYGRNSVGSGIGLIVLVLVVILLLGGFGTRLIW